METLEKPWGRLWFILLAFALLSGTVYLTAQLLINNDIKDPVFIGLMCGSAIIAYKASVSIFFKLGSFPHTSDNLKPTDELQASIFSTPRALAVAIPFSATFGVVTHFVSPWGESSLLNGLLVCFLVLCNLITGFALSAILGYYSFALEIGKKIHIELWDRSNETLKSLMEINDVLSKSVALVGAFAVSSTMFSVFELEAPVFIFTVFSALVVVSTFVIPIIPVTNRIRLMKKDHLLHLSKLIQEEYDSIVKTTETNRSAPTVERFEALIKTAKNVSSVRAFPPVAEKTLNSAAYVTLVTMLPATIDLILKTVGKL